MCVATKHFVFEKDTKQKTKVMSVPVKESKTPLPEVGWCAFDAQTVSNA